MIKPEILPRIHRSKHSRQTEMLKSKKALYILLPLTLVIWGLIGYKIYTGLKGDEPSDESISNFAPIKALNKASDTFTLFNNYKDPFLTDIHKQADHSFTNKARTQTLAAKNPSPVKTNTVVNTDWPVIQFSGILKNQTNAVSLLLLSIGGKTYTLKQGDIAEGLKVVSFTNAEVTLLRGKEKKVISR